MTLIANEPVESSSNNPALMFHATISAQEKQHILDGDYVVLTSTQAMPRSIKNAFATITRTKPFQLADPGSKYQATDVIDEPGLAHRRLIFAGVCKDRWFIHYEHGGIGISDAILVLAAAPDNSVRFVWGGSGFYQAVNLNDLRNAVASGKFEDDRAFYW